MEYLKFCFAFSCLMKITNAVYSTDTPQAPAPIPKGKTLFCLLLLNVCGSPRTYTAYCHSARLIEYILTSFTAVNHAKCGNIKSSIFEDVFYRLHDVTVAYKRRRLHARAWIWTCQALHMVERNITVGLHDSARHRRSVCGFSQSCFYLMSFGSLQPRYINPHVML